jgi:hypothetical protein
MKNELTQYRELNQIANKMSSEAWAHLVVTAILGDPDWYHDMVNETLDKDHQSGFWFGEYHGVFRQFSNRELEMSQDQFVKYISQWDESIEMAREGEDK